MKASDARIRPEVSFAKIVYRARHAPGEKGRVRVVGLDTETLPSGRCFLICTPEEEIDVETFPRSLFSRFPQGGFFVVWNLGFDSGSLLQFLESTDLDLLRVAGECWHGDLHIAQIPAKELKFEKAKITWTFWDMWQYYGMSLDKAARKYLGDQKKEIGISSWQNEEEIRAHKEEITEYCKHDALLCQMLAERMLDVAESWGVDASSLLSTAALSERHFTKTCHPYTLGRDFEGERSLWQAAFSSYSGGKFEVTRRGRGHFFLYDINSAYPAVIRDLVDLRGAKVVQEPRYKPHATYGFYQIMVDIDRPWCLPLAVRRQGVNCYPVGHLERTVTKPEYEYLVELGESPKIIRGWHVYPRDPDRRPFRDEIDRLYRLKEEMKADGRKGTVDYQLCKILMNSFYGKFMQLTPKLVKEWKEKLLRGEIDPRELPEDAWILEAGRLWNPVYASYITAIPRLRLSRLQNDHPAICAVATDSVMSTEPLPLPCSQELGDWNLEAEGDGLIIGSGVYQIDRISKFRGFAVKGGLWDWIEKADKTGDKLVIEIERPFSWQEVVFRGMGKEYINRFHKEKRELSINFEIRRLWERDWENVADMLESPLLSSLPLREVNYRQFEKEE